MEKRKFTIKEKVALIVLAALMVAAVVVGVVLIVGNTNRANDALLNTEHTTTEIITEAPTETETNADSTEKRADDNTEAATSSKTSSVAENSPTEAKSTTSKKPKTSKTTSNSGETVKPTIDKSIKPDKIVPTENETHASDDILTVNGKKCHVGDTVTVAVNLRTPKILENYQGYTEYDQSCLEYVKLNMNSGGLYNELDGVIYYNASIISGIDFTSEGTIYTATFKVKKAGSTQIKNTIQILTDTDDKPVKLSDCKEEIKVYD